MQDLADFAIKYLQKKGASYAEAKYQEIESNSFIVKNGSLDISSFDITKGVGIRFILNNKLGFLSTNILKKEALIKQLENSLKMTLKTKISENVEFSEEKANIANYEVKQKIKLSNVSADEKISILMAAEKEMRSVDTKVESTYIHLSDNETLNYYTNTDGSKIQSKIPTASFIYVVSVRENGKTSQRYSEYGGGGGFEVVKNFKIPSLLKSEVEAMKINLRHGKKPPQGVVDAVLGPQVSGIIAHESGGHPYEADRIFGREAAQAGESFVNKDMIGYKIGSEAVTIVDDPTVESGYGFYLYDDEGVKARRKYIIKNGAINEFLHNRQTAKLMGLKSNGSARSNAFDKEPIIRMSNTFFLPGDYTEEELIEDVKLGVYIKNFMEWNIDDKRINQKYVGSECYLIENGKIKNPIIAPKIETTTFKLYPSIDACGKNLEYHAGDCGKSDPLQGIPVILGGPSIRVRGVKVS
ncbi:TldD/PmbA family protein [Candidatus Woesearchaeota archaeon]|nr:TldD/PmbA family protein [Candidatus Woesearchaeota archaeon]